MQTLLITGANGFVGSNLYDLLSDDFRLIGLDIGSHGRYRPENFYGWNELDKIPPVDAIIHLAGKAHDTANTSAEQEYFDINLGLTQKIFDYFLQSGAQKFIFFSSVKAVADTVPGEMLTEDAEPKPLTAYGKSKLAAERYILEEEKRGRGEENDSEALRPKPYALSSKQVYILRPVMIHGPGNKGNLNLLYKVVKKGIPWPLGAFDNRRSFASIGNVAFTVRRILENDIAPGTYNLADDDPVSTNDLIRLISSIITPQAPSPKPYALRPQLYALRLKPHASILNVPRGLIRALARSGDVLHLPLNSERLKKLTENYVVSNNRLKEALGVEKMPVSAVEGLELTIRSFL
jgi:nucleoside-diphosphate-sugar epimerase